MAITGSQTLKNNRNRNGNLGDNESNASFPDLNSRNYNMEINDDNSIEDERDHEKVRKKQPLMEMNRQIGELVKTLTEKYF